MQIRASSHAALYNWGVALSDMARVQRAADPSAATDYLISAADKYAASLQWNPHHPQVPCFILYGYLNCCRVLSICKRQK